MRKLNLDGEDSEIKKCYSLKERQIQLAEQKIEEIDQIVKQKLNPLKI